ncbi:biotin/lipoyl-containing protein, partial [Bradyrhizobium sp.]|uniref:biotin/lipoyl-containing protein n=1 Tax=Bradyrhizobium sp. TaxID=376 RepID=UPI003C77CB89
MDVVMPQLGETVAEGKILTWFRNVGDEVKEGDNIFEIETDKVTVEVPATTAGRLTEIRASAGSVVKVGTVVAVIGGGAPLPSRPAAPWPSRSAAQLDPFNEVPTAAGRFAGARGPDGVRATPLARRLIAQHGIDLALPAREAKARGDNRIRASDVRAALH